MLGGIVYVSDLFSLLKKCTLKSGIPDSYEKDDKKK